MIDDKLGPTGEFPQGKLNADDEGALNCAISHENGCVRIDFGKPVAWLVSEPEPALEFAAAIIRHAMALTKGDA
jgi:hypothetical protein